MIKKMIYFVHSHHWEYQVIFHLQESWQDLAFLMVFSLVADKVWD